MGRIAVLTISIIVLLSTATPSALEGAQGPPEDVDLDFTASEIGVFLCEFDIRFQVSGKQGMIELPGGGLIITSAALRATLTNLTSQGFKHRQAQARGISSWTSAFFTTPSASSSRIASFTYFAS